MSPVMLGCIGFLALFALLAAGMPIGFALAFVGFVGMTLVYPFSGALVKMSTVPFGVLTDYSLAVLPLFLLMAQVTLVSGFGKDLFRTAAKWLGHLRGGLAMAAIGGSAGFAAVSGSSMATAATVGVVSLPEMKKYGYDPRLASGAVAAGGTIGSLLPPSGMFIIYGVITGTSIGKLFAGSLIPAFLTILSYLLTIWILCRRNHQLGPPAEKVGFRARAASLRDCWELLALIVFVIGGMIVGWFTATEAGAIGALGAIILSTLTGRLTFAALRKAFVDTMQITGMIYGIILGAFVFNYFCAKTTLPEVVAAWVSGLNVSNWTVMSIIVVIYLLLGMVMEAPSIQLLTLPVFYPIVVTTMGFDPVWFGVIQVRLLEISLIMPPLGMCAYVISGLDQDLSLATVFRGAFPFLLMEIVTLPIFMFITPLTLWLPGLMR